MMKQTIDDILAEVKRALSDELGEQLVAIRLFGSYARGDERADSDIDLLVLVRQIDDYTQMIRRTSIPVADISLRYDVVLSRIFAEEKDFREQQTPFFMNVRRESIAV